MSLASVDSQHQSKPRFSATVEFLYCDPHCYTCRVKAIYIRRHPNDINRDSGIDIPEAWMRSRNTTTGELYDSRPPREQYTKTARIEMHQSQVLKISQSHYQSILQ